MPQSDHRAEVAAEQAHVDAAYARLDGMRRSASRVSEAYAEVRRGGTHQARLERDIAVDVTHRRLAALDIGDAPLCFGRIDLEGDRTYHVGRIAVDDAEHTPLVVDWRAPVAEPFYRATAVEPMGVVRRRHFQTRRGRELVGLDDEVFDADASAQAGFTVLGEGALLAALDRHRTGRMGDIVATIQAEQDEAIRAELGGILVVAGGAGTGKTAVALHRAAYLLYTHRRRLRSQGVLLVGPTSVFLRYIEQVLPSLGEHDVQLATLRALKPHLRIVGPDPAEVAVVKGDVRMAKVIAKAVRDRERALPRDIVLILGGFRLRISRRDSARIVERARRRRGFHNARRSFVVRSLLEHLGVQYRAALAATTSGEPLLPATDLAGTDSTVAGALARGETSPEEWERDLRARLRATPEVREALERMWPVLSGAELVHDLFSFTALIRSAAHGVLGREELQGLERARSTTVDGVPWTDSDIALVDEADALLGPPEAARPAHRSGRAAETEALEVAGRVVDELGLRGRVSATELAARFAPPNARPDTSSGLRIYGHVLVDEAQDLTPMEWRMLARRSPSGSMTLVGDFGQASRPGAAAGWDEVLDSVPRARGTRFVTLTVNYRTPAEIMELAHRILSVAAPQAEPSRAVRNTGSRPRFVAVAAGELVSGAAHAARDAVAAGGLVAVIAPGSLHDALVDALADVRAVAGAAAAIEAPVAVLTPVDAKGLEFDHVVVVEPAELVTPDPVGLRLLYVAVTRATRTLAVVHAAPLPEALEP